MNFLRPLALSGLLAAAPLMAMAQTPERDLAQEEANRALVVSFFETVFNEHKVAEGGEVLIDAYKQHNPHVPDGKEPFLTYFTGHFKDNPDATAELVRSAADGDLVWLHVLYKDNKDDRGTAAVDIFRVTDGKITEHWDVLQPVPETSANNNTMF